ncbi:MAG: ribonuclease HI [Ignavibacteriales bacterium]|mgnify:CR=1 FL=1|jgi:ribonuclease HI|nr:ribonuclease HI [Ignavibacteriaceae bacterium]NLH61332.1 ribonuclease HI [Ignavibacteriales bacterium]HOJ18630.1 ribonuclease HI [Ignavibacteriaceae bacterium]HPO55237.1 ribonuclease HI [Ignavibacteriaceae bacterium]
MDKLKEIYLYTDGASSGNPGPGGYAALLKYGNKEKKLSGGFKCTTNNRMELMAVIVGLEALKQKCRVKVFSDSSYVVNAVNKGWLLKWEKNNWKRKSKLVPNSDLWSRFSSLLIRHEVEFHWIRGHNGHPENEICDKMAVAASKVFPLPDDTGYFAYGPLVENP